MFPQDLFFRLPTPTALLLLSSLSGLTSAHVARQTPSRVPYRPLNVVPLPAPTSPPLATGALTELLRRDDTDTICGYIDSDPKLPATCSAGSHCVKDIDQNVIGCCPNGQDTCTTGVFTACVDANSGPQSELNPYIFTCTGTNVCYKNVFNGGASQYGCGTASDLAATVADSATGLTSDVTLQSVTVSFTASAETLSTSKGSVTASSQTTLTISSPTTLSSLTPKPTSSESTTSTASSKQSSTQSSTASVSSSSTSLPSGTDAPATSGAGNSGYSQTGAIVGGTFAGVVFVAGLVALGLFLWRRRAGGNARKGPGPRPGDTQYISPMSGGPGFTPLDSNSSGVATVKGKTITHITGVPNTRNTVWHYSTVGSGSPTRNSWGTAGAEGAAAAGAAGEYRGARSSLHDDFGEDEVPLRHGSPEIDDFSRGFNDALSRIGEEDEEDLDEVNGTRMSPHGNGGSHAESGDLGEQSRPLWLQPRRQSRNLMWT